MATHVIRAKFREMKNSFAILLVLLTSSTYGQWVNCSETSIPGQLEEEWRYVAPGENTTAPTYVVSPSGTETPYTEFAIVKAGTLSADGLGEILIGSDDDGIFNPMDYGLMNNDSFRICPISYNIDQVRDLVDSIYFGDPTCCDILALVVEGFCDTLSDQGINSSQDVESLNELAEVMSILYGVPNLSLPGLVFRIDEINNSAGGILPGYCGGGSFPLCFAVSNPQTYVTYTIGSVNVEELQDIDVQSSYGHDHVSLTVSDEFGDLTVELYSISGHLLLQSDFSSGTCNLPLGPNVRIARVVSESGLTVLKIRPKLQ